MELEAVCRVSMSDLSLKICGKIDDIDSVEWTLFRAYTAADAKSLRDESDLRFWRDLDTQLPCPHNGTGLLAFLTAFLRLTFIAVDYGDSSQFVRHSVL